MKKEGQPGFALILQNYFILHKTQLEKSRDHSSMEVFLNPEQVELIKRLVYLQEKFDRPSKESLRKISTPETEAPESEAMFKHITEMTIITVLLIVEFSKNLPGFDPLLKEDKITLLKACSSELVILRGARRYDTQHTDLTVLADNLPCNQDCYNLAGMGETVEPLFRFGQTLASMNMDNAEYALITSIVIFAG